MSIKLMTAVWGINLPDSEKLVLLALADNANDEGVCWPSIATIAEKCSKSERTIQRAISTLESAGHLSRTDKPGKGTVWHVHPRHDVTPDTMTGVTSCRQTPVTVSPKPSRTTNLPSEGKPSSGTRARDRSVFEIPDWIPSAAWSGWLEMRKRAGRPPGERACQLAVEKLRKLADDGHPPDRVLDQSTLNGWSGLFEVKELKHERSGQSGRPAPGRNLTASIAAALDLDRAAR